MFLAIIPYLTTFFGTVTLGIFGWAFTLSGRVGILEAQHKDLKDLINTRFDSSDQRLGRIERSMNGHLKG